ncbi:glycerol-3-phosphate dehydrogenase/oxidase [Alkalicoccobacillus porphyridii]|uniref:Glycerol-3-phosphate dehydrogenase n=1 Tax=Alkalicoccobacillus porphyridii TaxID=2597270 RepID=A0A553ZWH2_9BACI|nr:glycerol-3-phosphate dehydrogenase/oxidase [Alkalicoccobacillus porphyridii]TSB45817.1 glycerol-3-phosphate dehydrogenase/oxidase [Alkalicoccobacillus porphyridii]
MAGRFSGERRNEQIEALKQEGLEVLIIGGGITGAGIALDAQMRGLHTGLIEQHDFASGSSSRSNKLIQGGLSYIRNLDAKTFTELGKERAIILDNAPHLVSPINMLLPVYKKGAFGRIQASLSLRVYDRLAELNKKERRHMLNKRQAQKQEPLLQPDNLKGGGYYVEYQTNDARLTIEVLKVASARGTLAVSYLKAESFLYEQGRIAGVMAVDQLTGEAHKIYAKHIVNATGASIDNLREQDRSLNGSRSTINKKIHIVIDHDRLPIKQGIYFEHDGHMLYAITYGEKVYIGPGDQELSVAHTASYLLNAIQHLFPTTNITFQDIEALWVDEEAVPATSAKQDKFEDLTISSSGLISVRCKQMAAYRLIAEKVVDTIEKERGESIGSQTDSITLSGGQVGGVDRFDSFLKTKADEGEALGIAYEEAYALALVYGSNITNIWSRVRTSRRRAQEAGLPPILFAQLTYAIDEEMVISPLDFLIRRTQALYFNRPELEKWKDAIFLYMQDRFQWSEEESSYWQTEMEQALKENRFESAPSQD